jgi:formiminoglutamase
MTVDREPIWQGRNDNEEMPFAYRWHHRVIGKVDAEKVDLQSRLGLLGFCCDVGVQRNQGRPGAASGPIFFRDQMRNVPCHDDSTYLIDYGNVTADTGDLENSQIELANAVSDALVDVKRLLVVGGGHETAYGSFMGLRAYLGEEARIGIINLDAHFDLRKVGPAGPSSGTPFYQIHDLVGADNFHYFCLGVAEESNVASLFRRAEEWGVQYMTDHDIEQASPDKIKAALTQFAKPLDALYLTLDLDVLPHYQMPGVSAPAVRGVTLQAIEMIIDQVRDIQKNCKFGLPLVEITELNPSFDPQGVSARTAAVLANRMLKD